jgi:hypothetical protein
MQIDKTTKPHNNFEFMRDLAVAKSLSNKEISNLLYISKKLVAIKMKEHGIRR